MKNSISSLVVVLLLLSSCKKEETIVPTTNEAVSAFSDSYNGPIDTSAVTANTVAANPNMMTTTQTTTIPAPVATAKGMNPAHGQPGHRCDISVGAPLNSAPNKPGSANFQEINTSKPTTTISSNTLQPGTTTSNGATITTTNNAPATVSPDVTPEGMNPPHGQEGHVCSVAVGAPLPK